MFSNSRTIFNWVSNELTTIYDQEEANSIAYLLIEEVLKIKKVDILTGKEVDLTENKKIEIETILGRLRKHEPIQYILGNVHFYGMELLVDKSVLIPRQETEELVDWILKETHLCTNLLDIGTGSGCIAIALAKNLPATNVSAWDISEEALNVAQENANRQDARVSFHQVDVLSHVSSETFDLIVSNPPYIKDIEKYEMQPNVLDYEPEKALFVPDDDHLRFYKAINRNSHKLLNAGGWLYYEINEAFGEEVIQSMEDHSFVDLEIRKDINGKDRMIRGRKP